MNTKTVVVTCLIELELDITGTALDDYQVHARAKEIARDTFSDYDMAVEHVSIIEDD